MSLNRSFDSLFLSLQTLVEKREREEKKNPNQLQCLCGKNEYTSAQEDEDNYSLAAEEQSLDDDKEPIYLERSPQGMRFAVCPSCNPRLRCERCEGRGHRVLSHIYVLQTEEGEESEYKVDDLSPYSCSCTRTEHLVVSLNEAEIPEKYLDVEMSSILTDHLQEKQKNKLQENIQKITRFCSDAFSKSNISNSNQKNKKYFTTLFGPVGSGKTLIACAALKMAIMDFNVTGRFVDFQFLLNKIKAEYEQKKSGENIMKILRNVDILVIDEFGKGRSENEWQLEKLDDLVNSRYNAKKTTIITTNYLPPNYKYDEKEIPRTHTKVVNDFWNPDDRKNHGGIPVNESFWMQNLLERVGARIYERMIEVSDFIDFTGIPSYRKILGKSFLDVYASKHNGR